MDPPEEATTPEEAPTRIGLVCLFLIVTFGGVSIWGGYTLVYQPLQFMLQAEAVDGTVASTTFEENTSGPSGDEYKPIITYRYTYEDSSFTNDNLTPSPNDTYSSIPPARNVLENHSPEEKVTVYVDPSTPSRSFLIREPVGLFSIGLVLVSIILTLGGIQGLVNVIQVVRADKGDPSD